MAYMVIFNGHGKKRNKHIRSVREYATRRGRYYQRPFTESVFEFLSAIFLYLVILAILAGIVCLFD